MANQIKTILLLGVLSALLIAVGDAVSPGHIGTFVLMAAVMNLGAYWFSDRVVLRMSGAREVGVAEAPDLHAIVDDLARRAGIPKPRVCVMDQPQPNAFATGRNPAHGVVAVTTGILQALDRNELRAVLAHEIGHIANRDILISSIAAVMATAIGYLGQSLAYAAMFGGGRRGDDEDSGSGLGALFVVLLAPLAATLVQLGISRSREYLADEAGAAYSGEPRALASALRKLEQWAARVPAHVAPGTASLYIVNPLTGGQKLSRLFSTHPSTEERVERLLLLEERMRSGQGGARTIPSQGPTLR